MSRLVRKFTDYEVENLNNMLYGGSIAGKAYMYAVNKYIDRADPKHIKSRRLYEGEYHVPLHNFTGPGTRMDLKEVRDQEPYNSIDACSKVHDIEYGEIKRMNVSREKKSELIMDADRKAIECYNKTPHEYGYLAAKSGISGKLTFETLLSILMGKPTTLYGGLIHNYTDGQLMAQRKPEYYTDTEKEIIDLLKIEDSQVMPVGSFTFSIQKYPSDIDINENVVISSVNGFVKNLKAMIKKISSKSSRKKGIFFSDFKAGEDKDGNGIHWSVDEIMEGKKKIEGKEYLLTDALQTKSVIKIDIIVLDHQRIIEASAFFILYLKEGDEIKPINIDENFFDTYVDNLAKDIVKYKSEKPFKAIKRLWSLSRIKKDIPMLRKLSQLIDSNVSVLGQISADLETIELLLDKYGPSGMLDEKKVKEKLISVVNGFQKRLSTVDDMESLSEILDKVQGNIDVIKWQIGESSLTSKKAIDMTKHIISEVHDDINKIIKKETNDFLKYNKIFI